ncbi:glycosyltransferase [Gilvimarinus sp. 1_MG-2023]|uniref:glycosyltransferase n=1 Tax=Gilvimarinus sp. 1_MG-2023 TaxID=3062638 RepID=UPI0026E16260|nr:glycosyltransferase [Gilvimarinus sp. 1_MG-2023]MDO6746783.1 glycosyltransferase [Gilvimarinus sp. 1_MG-2023]
MKVSVCLASFNGARFIDEQIASILAQLGINDELIIADDHSQDATRDIIQKFQDPRITVLLSSKQRGHVASFAKAIAHATGDIIVLSDQDDIWLEGRQDIIRNALADKQCALVAGNFSCINRSGTPLESPASQLHPKDSARPLSNIIGIFLGKRPYYGCAMAFRCELKSVILPIPALVESHDLWIAMAANLTAHVKHIEQPLLAKRFHSDNLSSQARRRWPVLIQSRVKFLAALLILSYRAIRQKVNSAR